MSEVSDKKYNELIKAGQTKESFLSRFKMIFGTKDSDVEMSIFDDITDDETISLLFNSVTSAHNDGQFGDTISISQKDVDIIANYDGDNSSVSEKDMILYYQDKLKELNTELDNSIVSDDPEISPDMKDNTQYKPQISSAKALDLLSQIKMLKLMSYSVNKSRIMAEIDTLIQQTDSKTRKQAEKINKKIKKTDAELKEKYNLQNAAKNEIDNLNAEIAKKQSMITSTKDENSKKNLTNELKKLNSKLDKENKTYTALNKNIANLKKERVDLLNELSEVLSNTSVTEEIQTKQNELNQVDKQLENDLIQIEQRMQTYQTQLVQTVKETGAKSIYYADVAKGFVNDNHVGKNAAQALSNAIGEIGVRESTGHNDGAAVAKYRGGVNNGAHWCASFVSWCYKGNNVFGYQAAVSGIRAKAQEKGLYSTINSGYIPKAGDVMIQKNNGASHTGIVESVDADGTIHTIEGNASNMVKRVTYKVGSKGYNKISGFVRMSDAQSA